MGRLSSVSKAQVLKTQHWGWKWNKDLQIHLFKHEDESLLLALLP